MDNYRKEHDPKILEPLKNRPDLEPDAQFVSSLRVRLVTEQKNSSRLTLKKPPLTYFLASVLAAGLFFILAAQYLPSYKKAPAQVEHAQGQNFDEAIKQNDAYREFYEKVSKVLAGSEFAKIPIYYLESLRMQDTDSLRTYLFEEDLQTAQALLKHYEGMDHSSIAFENMVPSDDGASYDIFFTYLDSGEMKNGSFQLKTVDGKNTYIYDLPDEEEEGEGIPDFELTKEESQAYEAFALDHNREYLKELSPISIAKLYIQAQLDQDYHTKYALYTSRKDRQLWTLDEELAQSAKDMLSTGALLESLAWVTSGEFIKDDEISGHIEFTDEYGNTRGFNMIMDEDGIWKVAFQPIQ